MNILPLSAGDGLSKPSFHPVPLKHDYSIPGLYAFHAEHSPDHPVFAYADFENGITHNITYVEAWRDIRKVAATVSARCSLATAATGTQKRQIISILALSDTLSYVYLTLAIMSLGHIAFPLSPRNSPVVTAHLLEKVGVDYIFVSEDPDMQALAKEANELLVAKGLQAVNIVAMTSIMNLDPEDTTAGLETGIKDIADTDVAIILHSSGTTAYPKPIPLTRRGLINLANIPQFGEMDLTGKRIAAHTNPVFHAMGLATILWPITSGATFVLYKPVSPPAPPTPANFLESWTAAKCNIVFCIPVFLESWARDAKNISLLKALDCVIFSGASVNKYIGDALAQEGVVMHPFWGSTEVGPATMYIPKEAPPTHEWEYFKISKHIKFRMQSQENMDGIYEPIMIPTETCFPPVFNSELDGQPVYAVGDLLERHPTDPERWKVYGRKDDQIMLSTAENVNPLPIEATLLQDKNIAAALLFGRGHYEIGVLINPSNGVSIPENDEVKRAEYIASIWPVIEKANTVAPKYANIQRKRIVLTSSSKPLEYTPKGTPRRAVCLSLYAAEIEEVYQDERDALLANDRQFPDRV
ncbi:hypothetical protein EIP86_008575 [Pleurotus ostreatoroseus]|nr:hypothetical protein EIP86_008575 [Pleurotus ostreatoroseus]